MNLHSGELEQQEPPTALGTAPDFRPRLPSSAAKTPTSISHHHTRLLEESAGLVSVVKRRARSRDPASPEVTRAAEVPTNPLPLSSESCDEGRWCFQTISDLSQTWPEQPSPSRRVSGGHRKPLWSRIAATGRPPMPQISPARGDLQLLDLEMLTSQAELDRTSANSDGVRSPL
ncbi:unnamed protein product [Cuscuta europaea]|uniref:Uncharacterized protein n=1 Tax=Cuscuta europaea TaxID=41803 RepID=A0A9P0ZEF6_CUSEU|nr:unnamed protein product [Cuscuta europaea]